MSSLSVKAALSVYGKTASATTGKPVSSLSLEDLIQGIVAGRRQEGDMVDRVLCYRSAFNESDIQLSYCQGVNASIAVLGSQHTRDARVLFADGAFTDGTTNPNYGIPDYLREEFAKARALAASAG